MDRTELLKYHDYMCTAAKELMKRKNHDYCGKIAESSEAPNPFANFCRCEHMGICTTEAGFLVRLTDKFSRLSSFIEQGVFKVEDEKLDDTLQDIINYCILFGAYLVSKKDEANHSISDKHPWEITMEDIRPVGEPIMVRDKGVVYGPDSKEHDPNCNMTSACGNVKDSDDLSDPKSRKYESVPVRDAGKSEYDKRAWQIDINEKDGDQNTIIQKETSEYPTQSFVSGCIEQKTVTEGKTKLGGVRPLPKTEKPNIPPPPQVLLDSNDPSDPQSRKYESVPMVNSKRTDMCGLSRNERSRGHDNWS